MIRTLFTAFSLVLLALPARAIDIQEVTSPGGITAWLVEERSIPFVALEVRFKGGASLDREGKRGAINLMSALIEEGASDLDSTGFAAAREALAASYGFSASDDAMSISAQFLTENRDEALALLRSAIMEPRFDQSAIDRVRAQVVSGLKSDEKDPSTIARNAMKQMSFGDHPYGSASDGTIASVEGLTRDDIVNAYTDVMARDRVFVSAVGDIGADELGAILDDLLGALPETGAPMPADAPVLLEGGTTVIPFDGPQSTAIFGHVGIERDDPDFFAAFVMNQIFGAGGFGSRLMEEVREKRGLTYGVYSYLLPKDHGELFLGQVSSSNDRIAQAIDVIRDEWAKLAADGVTAQELEDAKKYLTGAYPLRFDGNDQIASILVGMQMDDLPIDYADTRNDKVNAVTQDDIKRIAARLLRPDDLHFIVVGQPEELESTN